MNYFPKLLQKLIHIDKYLLKEKINHGSYNFPIGIHKTNINSNISDILYLHWHEELEFLVITEGSAIFQVNNYKIEVSKGEGIFINSNLLHCAYSSNNNGCSFFAIVFHPSFISNYLNDTIKEKYINPILNDSLVTPIHLTPNIYWQNNILTLLNEIFLINEKTPFGFELLIKSNIYKIWYLSVQNITINTKHTFNFKYKYERLKKILSFIDKNYSRKITILELSNIIYMSEEHFCRFFKEITNYTPISYINNFRIQKSCALLKETDKNISEIANLVGFENTSYYNKKFLEIMKCTPSKYRILKF